MVHKNCRDHGKKWPVKLYSVLMSLVLVFFVQCQPAWAADGEGKDLNLIFSNWSGIEISVHASPDGKGEAVEVVNGQATLENVQKGQVYSYVVNAPGYYSVTTAFAIDEQDILLGSKRLTAQRQRRAGRGYEAVKLQSWGEPVEKVLFDEDTLRGVDLSLLDTPAFKSTKAANAFTTVSEGIEYLRGIEGRSQNAYLYFLDDGQQWPVMFFTETDLSSADRLEEALSLLANDEKLKMLYQAQIHGNEPAAGEGALTVAKTLSADKEGYLNNVDVVMVPYVNRYGAEKFIRGGNSSGLNLNRDSLALRADSTKRLHWLFGQLMPEVFVDGHEFGAVTSSVAQSEEGYYFKWQDDIQVTCVNILNRQSDIYSGEMQIVKDTLSALQSKGFRTFMYKPSSNNTTSCNYARLMNSYSFLLESNGIGLGKNHFERRVLSHHEGVMSILKQVSASSQTIRQKVKAAREELVRTGRTYSSSDKFVLKHGISQSGGISIPRPSFDFFGRVVGSPYKTDVCYNTDVALRSRTRPTAYIISKKAAGAKTVRNTLTANGVKYFELEENARVSVKQYGGTETKASLSEKKKVTFAKGAYVFFMDQKTANIIAASMEPDVNDTAGFNGTFVQSGVIRKVSGKYPIYRYEGKNPQENLKLSITKEPSSAKAKGKSSVRFSAKGNGGKVTYKWYYKAPKCKTWKVCKESSGSKSTLVVKKGSEKKGYQYRCVIGNGAMDITTRIGSIKK